MQSFAFARAAGRAADAARLLAESEGSKFLAGGTTLIDLMKCGVEQPKRLVDITRINGLSSIELTPGGGLRLGALAKMADVADHADVARCWPAVSEALNLSASAQLRNMATIGGNLLQQTRCPYFRDVTGFPECNKRKPGSGCAAIEGDHRGHAILGVSDQCIATHPSDVAVVFAAFEAMVHAIDRDGNARRIPLADFYLLPATSPDRETSLSESELVVALELPPSPAAGRSRYLKIRDRQSYEFALASAAVGLDIAPDGVIRDARIALGGVATVPWRSRTAELVLQGRKPDLEAFRSAAELAVAGAAPRRDNFFKLELVKRTVVRALKIAAESGQ